MKHIQKFENYGKVNESIIGFLGSVFLVALGGYLLGKWIQILDTKEFNKKYEKTTDKVMVGDAEFNLLNGKSDEKKYYSTIVTIYDDERRANYKTRLVFNEEKFENLKEEVKNGNIKNYLEKFNTKKQVEGIEAYEPLQIS